MPELERLCRFVRDKRQADRIKAVKGCQNRLFNKAVYFKVTKILETPHALMVQRAVNLKIHQDSREIILLLVRRYIQLLVFHSLNKHYSRWVFHIFHKVYIRKIDTFVTSFRIIPKLVFALYSSRKD